MRVRRAIAVLLTCSSCSTNVFAIDIAEPPSFAADVQFVYRSSELPADAISQLERVLRFGRGLSGRRVCVDVVGNSDGLEAGLVDAGPLALRRAQLVAAVFQAEGYETQRIYIESKAATQPIAPVPSPKNARVGVEVREC